MKVLKKIRSWLDIMMTMLGRLRLATTKITQLRPAMMTAALVLGMVASAMVGGYAAAATSAEGIAAENGSLMIAAVNPGYTVDGVSNTGEVIVLKNMSGKEILLAGYTINYINSNGNASVLLEFPEGSSAIGEILQLRLATEAADLSYSKSLAMSGGLELLLNGETVDKVCWNGSKDCYKKFTSDKPTTLVRNFETWGFEHVENYVVNYDAGNPGIRLPEIMEEPGRGEVTTVCGELEFSELLSYYETDASEQFVEFHNRSDGQMTLTGCSLRYKNKEYPLSGVVGADEYIVYRPDGFTLTKNPTSQNTLEIIDANGAVVDTLIYYNGQKKGVAWAQMGYDATGAEQWVQTYAPTPGRENDYQKYKTCEAGKVINEETGNCVKDGSLDTTQEACPEGKYRNPLTGRCKSYATNDEPKACAEGYERNPETGRCKKITSNTGADYALTVEEVGESTNFVAVGAVAAVGTLGTGYAAWQFRREIAKLARKVWGVIRGLGK